MLFEEIICEEKIFSKDGDEKFPGFGFSHSPFADVVRPFYSYWLSFVTQKSFKWCDYYDCKTAVNRAESRAMERENKPIRDNAKKQYNKNMRALVLYIKKRDPRILQMKQDELTKENIKTSATINKLSNGCATSNKDYNWNKHYQEYHQDIDVIENLIDDEFCDRIDQIKIDKLEDKEFEYGAAILEANSIICLLCNSAFQSLKSFRNHSKSRSHIELFQAYKKKLKENENATTEPSPTINNNAAPEPMPQNISGNTTKSNILLNIITCPVCGELFISQNQLSDHVKEARHVSL
ncbi:hypothetical protein MXB_1697, partial [Myxobolus squamalis]